MPGKSLFSVHTNAGLDWDEEQPTRLFLSISTRFPGVFFLDDGTTATGEEKEEGSCCFVLSFSGLYFSAVFSGLVFCTWGRWDDETMGGEEAIICVQTNHLISPDLLPEDPPSPVVHPR